MIKKVAVSEKNNKNHLFSKKLTAIAVSSAMAATPAVAEWDPRVEIFLKPGNERSYAGVDALVPMTQDANSLTFADLKANLGESDSREINLGIGHRFLSEDKKKAYGFYGAWDRRNSERDNEFDQITVGAEVLTREYDLRFNYYYPIDDAELLSNNGGTSYFEGNNVYTNGIYEEAMEGFDVEVGALLPVSDKVETRAFLAGYYFDGDDIAPSATGVRARIEARLNEAFTVGASVQDDDEFDTAAFLEVRYALGKSTEKTGIRTLKQRMNQPWVRDDDVVISDPEESSSRGDAELVEELEDKVVHINNDPDAQLTDDEPDGSFENPYPTVADCEMGKCGETDEMLHGEYRLVRMWQGLSQVETPYDGIQLEDGQTLWGEGVDIFDGKVSHDKYPLIETEGTGVMLASNDDILAAYGPDEPIGNTVTGVEIIASTGISGTNTFGDVNIYGNKIAAYGEDTGIQITNVTGLGEDPGTMAEQTVSITDNQIYAPISSGVGITNIASYGTSIVQSVTVADNEINAAYAGAGITEILTLRQNAAVSFSNISKYSVDGYTSSIEQEAMVTGNTISSGETAIASTNWARSWILGGEDPSEPPSAIQQNLMVTNNQISLVASGGEDSPIFKYGLADGGITLFNVAGGVSDLGEDPGEDFSKGSVTQTAQITGNTLTIIDDPEILEGPSNTSSAISSLNWAKYETSTLTQTLMVDSNTTIDQNTEDAFYFNEGVESTNIAKYGASSSQVLTVSNNNLDTKYDSVSIANYAIYDGLATVVTEVTGNTLSSARGDGIVLDNRAGDYDSPFSGPGGTANFTATVSGNTVSYGDDGVDIDIYAEASASSSFTATIENNTLTFNDYDGGDEDKNGIQIDARTREMATSISTLTISDNIIDAAYDEGVDVEHKTDGEDSSSTMNLTLAANTITANDEGVEIWNKAEESSNLNAFVTLADNTITSTAEEEEAEGVKLDNKADESATLTATFTLTGNSITATDNDAIDLDVYTDDSATSNVTLTATDNTLNVLDGGYGLGTGGIDVNLYTDDEATSNFTATITGNSITLPELETSEDTETWHGIYIDSVAYTESNANLTLTISGNTISAIEDGIKVDNDVYSGSTVTLNATISGNDITSGDDAIDVENSLYGESTANVNVTISDNDTDTTSGDDGIDVETNLYESSTLTAFVTITDNDVEAYDEALNQNIYIQEGSDFTGTYTISGNTLESTRSEDKDDAFDMDVTVRSGSDANLTVTVSENTIIGGDDGLEIGQGAYSGGDLTSFITISDNTITGDENEGVNLDGKASSGGSLNSTIVVTDNIISTSEDDGLDLDNKARSGGDLTISLNVSDNTISSADSAGVSIDNKARSGGDSTVNASILDNEISASGNAVEWGGTDGGSFGSYSYAESGGTLNNTLTVSGNTLTSSEGDGVFVFNKANYAGDANSTVTVSDNTIDAGKYGVVLINGTSDAPDAEASMTATILNNDITAPNGGVVLTNVGQSYGDTASQTATVIGNTITASDAGGEEAKYAGIFALNGDNDSDTAVQSITAANNNISGFKYGVAAYSYADTDGSSQTVTISGTTVTSGANTAEEAVIACNVGDADQTVSVSTTTLDGESVTGAVPGVYCPEVDPI